MAEFDWKRDDSVVLRHQDAVAVYQNADGDIMLRQEAPESDDVIIIARCYVPQLIYALNRLVNP